MTTPRKVIVHDAIGPFVSRLREQPGKDIWLMGGGEIIASFLDAQAIDRFGDGVVQLHYRVRKQP